MLIKPNRFILCLIYIHQIVVCTQRNRLLFLLKTTSFVNSLAKYVVHQLVEIPIYYNYEDIPKKLVIVEYSQHPNYFFKNYDQ